MVINKRSNTALGGLYLVYPYSVCKEEVGYRGCTHLLEHLMLKQTSQHPEWDRVGLNVNGETGTGGMALYMTGLISSLNKVAEQFYNEIQQIQITEEMFKSELEIIKREYTEFFSENESILVSNIMADYKVPNAIGDIKDLNSLTYDKVMEFYNKYLKYPQDIVFVSDSDLPFIPETFPISEDCLYSPSEKIQYHPNDFNAHVALTFEVTPENIILLKIFRNIMSVGLNSVFMSELRTKRGLVYSTPSDFCLIDHSKGVLIFIFQIDKKLVKEVITLIKSLLSTINKYITPELFEYYIDVINSNLAISNIFNYNDYQKACTPKQFLLEDNTYNYTYDEFISLIKGQNYKIIPGGL